jgi:hypothetical protein
MSPAILVLLLGGNSWLMSPAQMDTILVGVERSANKSGPTSLGRIEQATGLSAAPGPAMPAAGIDGVLTTEGVDPTKIEEQKYTHRIAFEGMRFKPARLVAAPGSQVVLVNLSPIALVLGIEGKGPKLKPMNPGEKRTFTVGALDPSTKELAKGFSLYSVDWRRARLEIEVAPPGRQLILLPKGEDYRVRLPELTEGVSRLSLLIGGVWQRSDEFILRQNSKLVLTLEMKAGRLDIVTKTTVAAPSLAGSPAAQRRVKKRRRSARSSKKRRRSKRSKRRRRRSRK